MTKRELAAQLLAEGKTPYAVNKACQKKFGSGIAYYDLLKIRNGLASKVTPVDLPPEILELPASEPEPEPVTDLTEVEPHTAEPEFIQRLRSVQDWMKSRRIQELVMDDKGRVSVLAWSEVYLGDSDG